VTTALSWFLVIPGWGQTPVTAGSTGKISVTTPGGTAQSAGKFTFIPPPEIRSFSPGSGRVGTEVIIKGKDLDWVTGVTLNGVPCVFSLRPGAQIRAVVPVGAGSGKIGVVSPGGSALSGDSFTVLP